MAVALGGKSINQSVFWPILLLSLRTSNLRTGMHFSQFPLLSDEDKAETSEGGLDPLGLVQVSEALAVRLVPGVRERMSHPRFLTAMAVAMEVCRKFPDETVAHDDVSSPWLVFEWLAVEGFVRTAEGRDPFKLPGNEKVKTTLRERVPLSAKRYLKSPNVFGFHGVYRGLSRDLGIESGGRLGETGDELLRTWAREQKLDGFTGSVGGEGASICEQLYSAVRDSLEEGEVKRGNGWQHWRFFRDHLAPHQAGSREAAVLRDALLAETAGFRATVLRFLASDQERKAFGEGENRSERAFHTALRRSRTAGVELGALLDAISSYETFSRTCQDAFDDVLVELTCCGGRKVTPKELSRIASVKAASKRVPEMFGELLTRLEPFRETARFAETFASLAERTDAACWVDQLLRHHETTQRKKPPLGKSPWFERYDDGGAIIRPLYRREGPGRHDDSYLHGYRTWPLHSFARDLRLILS